MQAKPNIYILSRPIHSGKTTALQTFIVSHNCNGILTPDVDGKRKVYDIARNTYHTLEVNDTDVEGKTIVIGKFRFDKSGFQLAQEILLRSAQQKADWLIIDEIGRLEIDKYIGLEPAVSKVITEYKNNDDGGNLLLVIRDYLLETAITHYGLQSAKVIDNLNDL